MRAVRIISKRTRSSVDCPPRPRAWLLLMPLGRYSSPSSFCLNCPLLSRHFLGISVERIVSGIGLANIYDFLAQREPPGRGSSTVRAEFENARADLKPVVVGQYATGVGGVSGEERDEVCAQALEIFMRCAAVWVGALLSRRRRQHH